MRLISSQIISLNSTRCGPAVPLSLPSPATTHPPWGWIVNICHRGCASVCVCVCVMWQTQKQTLN